MHAAKPACRRDVATLQQCFDIWCLEGIRYVARVRAQLEVVAPDAARAPRDEVVVDVCVHGCVGVAHPRLALRSICSSTQLS